MNQDQYKHNNTLIGLINEYEAMSQKGTVGFFEETVFIDLINHYVEANLLPKALEVIEHALNQHKYTAELYIRKAEIYLQLEKPAEALKITEEAIIYEPAEVQIFLLRAEAMVSLGLVDEAFNILDGLKSEASKPDLSSIYFCEALIFENLQDFQKMFKSLKQAILTDNRNSLALERLWLGVELSGKYEESIEIHQYIIDNDPYSHIAWYNLGHAYQALERHSEASDAFEYAFLIDEKFELAYRSATDSLIKIKRYESALSVFEDCLEHFDADADLLLKMGLCHQGLKNQKLAKTYYFEALGLNKQESRIYFRIGECYAFENNWPLAIGYYKKAYELNPRREEYMAALANAYYQTGILDKALIYYRKASDTAPETSKFWLLYANFLMDIGNEKEALEVLEESEMYVVSTDIKYCKTSCYFLLNNKKKAFNLLRDALIEDHASHYLLFEWVPNLSEDIDVLSFISAHKEV